MHDLIRFLVDSDVTYDLANFHKVLNLMSD